MSRVNKKIPLHNSAGTQVIRWEKKDHLLHMVSLGEVVKLPVLNGYGALTHYQYRVAEREESNSTPSNHSPASITYHEIQSLAGLHGPGAQRAARAKIKAWPGVYDNRAVCICAGIIHRPDDTRPEAP